MADDIITPEDFDRLVLRDADIVRLATVVKLRAKKPTRAQRRRSAAAKTRLYRQRQRMGQVVLKITVPEYAVAEFLVSSGRLSAAEALDRRTVERAIAAVVVELAASWQQPKKV
jgi:hypothetical protein